jgi:hypothetical protein
VSKQFSCAGERNVELSARMVERFYVAEHKTCCLCVATVAVPPVYSAVALTLKFGSGHLNCKYGFFCTSHEVVIEHYFRSQLYELCCLGAGFQSLTFQINHRYPVWSFVFVEEVAWATRSDPVGRSSHRKT